MDLSGLERLGKVAGIAGISVGAVVPLLNALVGALSSTGQCNTTARNLSAGVSKPKVFRGR
jgi:hypothetical protein